ncbi:hypothetical protein NONO_c46960 [Nocardia nova SH22a]|uniref:Secreted protein n=1 Tax=Nocardia nova SH22a TaxID=1415166 RepID=W5TJG4_9NOCA|nr:hypothetical protein [Nocardia nova]AHH19480.1 hypothetical protein NONO_c46960 [Nocardia nova SH22a]
MTWMTMFAGAVAVSAVVAGAASIAAADPDCGSAMTSCREAPAIAPVAHTPTQWTKTVTVTRRPTPGTKRPMTNGKNPSTTRTRTPTFTSGHPKK